MITGKINIRIMIIVYDITVKYLLSAHLALPSCHRKKNRRIIRIYANGGDENSCVLSAVVFCDASPFYFCFCCCEPS